MIVVPDTTVFENGFNERSTEVRLLRSYLLETGSELYVPEVVRQEAINRVRRRVIETNSKIESVHRLTAGVEGFAKIDPETGVRVYEESLNRLLDDLKARTVPFPKVSHDELTQRALVPQKPFVERGRGYRDALIWYTLVEILQARKDDVVFVSQNSGDWCSKEKEKYVFHLDFINDLNNKGLSPERLALVPTLADFNRSYYVSTLAVADATETEKERAIDYVRLLNDRKEEVANLFLLSLPNALKRMGVNIGGIGEFSILGLSSPGNVQHEPPRMLNSETRLLQFSAEYRLAIDLIIRREDASWLIKRFSFQLRRDWDFAHVDAYVTVPINATFHLIEKNGKPDQLSLASAEISEI
jgi:PIN domain